MDQNVLKALLEEAAQSNCTWERRNAIQCLLGEASVALGEDGAFESEGREAGMQLVLDKLYVDVIDHRPEVLPALFPVFALLCGDRKEGLMCADVDWSLVPSK